MVVVVMGGRIASALRAAEQKAYCLFIHLIG